MPDFTAVCRLCRPHRGYRSSRRLYSTFTGSEELPSSLRPIECYLSKTTNPWLNLAIEDWLFSKLQPNSYLLFLWRNTPCVVIGRNQNPWKEVNMRAQRETGVPVIRRKSGGGTVFHDLGNSVYTIMMPRSEFKRASSVELVVRALQQADVPAEVTPRFDIAVGGKKMTYKIVTNAAYHHGTMLIDSDLELLRKLLKTSKPNIVSKGVESVPSPVTRLREVSWTIDHPTFVDEVYKEFCRTNGRNPAAVPLKVISEEEALATPEIVSRAEELQSWEWTYGQTPEFTNTFSRDFDWGSVEVKIHSKEGRIVSAEIAWASFSEDVEGLMERLEESLPGRPYALETFEEVFEELGGAAEEGALADLKSLFDEFV